MKSKTREENRRKDDCVTCNRFMPIKAKGNCQNCWHKIKRKTNPKFFLSTRYTEIVQRCSNPNNNRADLYNGFNYCSRDQFMKRFLTDPIFLEMFKIWNEANYDNKLVPSIDRINTTLGYTLDNIQVITHSENCTKDQDMTPISCYTKNKTYIRDYESQGSAARDLNLEQSNIWKVLNKKRKHTGGFYFEYKNA